MIGSTRALRVWAYAAPADLRKGFDGLAGLVTVQLRQDPLGGDCFLFVNLQRTRAKVLLWDGTGLCVYHKRLEQGRFALWPRAQQPDELAHPGGIGPGARRNHHPVHHRLCIHKLGLGCSHIGLQGWIRRRAPSAQDTRRGERDRWAALEPIRQGMTTAFGSIAPKVALGVALRHDWGSQYTANTFVNEIKCWGFTDTPAFVGEPECNGCAERFMRTLKEQCLYLHQFRDLEEAREIIGAFIARYNAEWIVERLGYRTPVQARRDALAEAA
jgi:hypothetical protein